METRLEKAVLLALLALVVAVPVVVVFFGHGLFGLDANQIFFAVIFWIIVAGIIFNRLDKYVERKQRPAREAKARANALRLEQQRSERIDALYGPNWPELRRMALQRDGYRCGNCGLTTNLHVHHIVPLSKGGTNQLNNLRTLCRDCHTLLHPHMQY